MTLVMHRSRYGVSREELYRFHMDVRNLARISPPFPKVTVAAGEGPTKEGDTQRITLSAGPLHRSWDARVSAVIPGALLEDVQETGPFRRWRHQHRFRDVGDGSELIDVISFSLVPGPAGEIIDWAVVRPALWGMLVWRHRRTARLLRSR